MPFFSAAGGLIFRFFIVLVIALPGSTAAFFATAGGRLGIAGTAPVIGIRIGHAGGLGGQRLMGRLVTVFIVCVAVILITIIAIGIILVTLIAATVAGVLIIIIGIVIGTVIISVPVIVAAAAVLIAAVLWNMRPAAVWIAAPAALHRAKDLCFVHISRRGDAGGTAAAVVGIASISHRKLL